MGVRSAGVNAVPAGAYRWILEVFLHRPRVDVDIHRQIVVTGFAVQPFHFGFVVEGV
jgi:hypothetical protein